MTKEELKQYRHIILEIERQNARKDDLYRAVANVVRAPSDTPVRGGQHDPYPDIMDKISKIDALVAAEIGKLLDLRFAIEKAILVLDSRGREIIRLRYIDGLSWEKVAVTVGYEWAQVHRIHGEGLKKMIHNDT